MKAEVKCSSKAGLSPIKREDIALGNRKRHQKSNNVKGTSTRNKNFGDGFNTRLFRQLLKNAAADNVSIDFNDVDDAEISGYLNNKKEMLMKKIIWEDMNKKYLKEKQLKAARKKKKKKATATKNSVKVSGDKENEKRQSSKINYDVLKRLMDEPEEVSKELDGSMHNDNAILEAHDSAGPNEDNYTYENENGHTNHSDADDYYHGDDMYGEYENNGYDYVEENDEDGFDYGLSFLSWEETRTINFTSFME